MNNGNFVITWWCIDVNLYVRIFDTNGVALLDAILVMNKTNANEVYKEYPAIVGLSDGKFVATLESTALINIAAIYAVAFMNNATASSAPFFVGYSSRLPPSIALLLQNVFVIVHVLLIQFVTLPITCTLFDEFQVMLSLASNII